MLGVDVAVVSRADGEKGLRPLPFNGPLRAGQLCQILDVGTEPKHREGMRSRLKRLVARGIPTETEPGLFTLVAETEPAQQP
ncbi:hypothetical protein [Streptomyces sp. NPDC002671]